ncbi:hypothetical protein C1646_819538 [Rhizophagus diaphanus]|nr:hypothetical protein C1646_819538 [Rhizophagus diaphanus] [Rhizophagus sp. MUCL 43196]
MNGNTQKELQVGPLTDHQQTQFQQVLNNNEDICAKSQTDFSKKLFLFGASSKPIAYLTHLTKKSADMICFATIFSILKIIPFSTYIIDDFTCYMSDYGRYAYLGLYDGNDYSQIRKTRTAQHTPVSNKTSSLAIIKNLCSSGFSSISSPA